MSGLSNNLTLIGFLLVMAGVLWSHVDTLSFIAIVGGGLLQGMAIGRKDAAALTVPK